MQFLRVFFFIFCPIVIGLWVFGFIWYAQKIPGNVKDLSTTTDAIVVLTGGKKRVEEGIQLLRENKAKKMLISGVHEKVSYQQLSTGHLDWPKDLQNRIVLGYQGTDTHKNGIETAEWMEKEGFNSLRLVTSGYHMRRSLLEFRCAMPAIQIIPHPVSSENIRLKGWWKWWGTTQLFLSEYNKYLLAQLMLFPKTLGSLLS